MLLVELRSAGGRFCSRHVQVQSTTARAAGTGDADLVQIPLFHRSSTFAAVFAFPEESAFPHTLDVFAIRKGQ